MEVYEEEAVFVVCILSTASTLYYMDASRYIPNEELFMEDVTTATFSDMNNLHAMLTALNSQKDSFISTIVIVDTGSNINDITDIHSTVIAYAFKIYIIPSLMARLIGTFDFYFKEDQIDYTSKQKLRLLTCANGIEVTRLNRECGSTIFKITKEFYHRSQSVADTLAHYSEASDAIVLALNNAEVKEIPDRLLSQVIRVPDYTTLLCQGGIIKALQIDCPYQFGTRIPFIEDCSDKVMGFDRSGRVTVFELGTSLPCTRVMEVVDGSEIYTGPRFGLNPLAPPKNTTRGRFFKKQTVYLKINTYGVPQYYLE